MVWAVLSARRWAAPRWTWTTRRACCGCSLCCSPACWRPRCLPRRNAPALAAACDHNRITEPELATAFPPAPPISRRRLSQSRQTREGTMDPWWSEATKLPFASQNGGAYIGGPFRGVIHTTEFKDYTPSTTDYYGKIDPPHFTLVMDGSDSRFYQHFAITVAARALEHNAGTIDTNRRSAIQIELAWVAAEIADLPEAMLERLWDWMRWVETQAGVKSWEYARFVGEGEGKGYQSSSRMTDN